MPNIVIRAPSVVRAHALVALVALAGTSACGGKAFVVPGWTVDP